jgi:hypothetical protein
MAVSDGGVMAVGAGCTCSGNTLTCTNANDAGMSYDEVITFGNPITIVVTETMGGVSCSYDGTVTM